MPTTTSDVTARTYRIPMLRSATIRACAEGNDDEGAEKAHEHDIRRQRKQLGIGRGRNQIFLEQILDAVGEPLKNPLRPDPVGPDPRLHARPNPPFEPTGHAGKRRDENRKHDEGDEHHRKRINDFFRHTGEGAVLNQLINIRLHDLSTTRIQRSISGASTSRLPIKAIRSASMIPLLSLSMMAIAVNDPVRIRTR